MSGHTDADTGRGGSVDPGVVPLHLTARVLRRLYLAVAVVVGLAAAGHVAFMLLRHGFGTTYAFGLVQFLDLDQEESLGTWLSCVLMLCCSAVSVLSALVARHRQDRWERNWWVLALVFALLSLDEIAALHENLIKPVRSAFGLSGVLYYAWVVPVSALGLLLLLSQVRFLRHLWRPIGRNLVLAGGVFVSAAVGLELVEGVLTTDGRRYDLLHAAVTGLQETGELIGMGLALCALLTYVVRGLAPLALTLPAIRT